MTGPCESVGNWQEEIPTCEMALGCPWPCQMCGCSLFRKMRGHQAHSVTSPLPGAEGHRGSCTRGALSWHPAFHPAAPWALPGPPGLWLPPSVSLPLSYTPCNTTRQFQPGILPTLPLCLAWNSRCVTWTLVSRGQWVLVLCWVCSRESCLRAGLCLVSHALVSRWCLLIARRSVRNKTLYSGTDRDASKGMKHVTAVSGSCWSFTGGVEDGHTSGVL